MVGLSVIVSPHHGCIVGIRTNDGNLLLILIKGQDAALILEEHYALTCHVEGDVGRLLGRHGRIGNLRPLHQ